MTAIELNAQKMEIIEMLLKVNDEKTVADILSYVRNSRKAPCRYSLEEMQERISKAEADIAAGRFIPHEEIRRKPAAL
jgi:predicted transcriptional regulator